MRPESLLILLIVPCAVMATILGWVSIAQIRRSGGKLRGLGLAVFDGLVFPLLGLFGIIAILTREFATGFMGWPPDDQARNSQGIVVTCVLFAVASFLIIRTVWKMVNKPTRRLNP